MPASRSSRVEAGVGLFSLRRPTTSAWASALAGFLVCALITLVLYLWLYFGAEGIADAHGARIADWAGEPEAEIRLWLIEEARRTAHLTAIFLLSMFVIYWLIAAAFGRRSVASSMSANGLLALAVAAFLAVGLNDYFGWADTYCDQLPFPHDGFQLAKIHECPSSSIFFLTLWQVSVWLMIASLAVRVITSRMRSKGE